MCHFTRIVMNSLMVSLFMRNILLSNMCYNIYIYICMYNVYICLQYPLYNNSRLQFLLGVQLSEMLTSLGIIRGQLEASMKPLYITVHESPCTSLSLPPVLSYSSNGVQGTLNWSPGPNVPVWTANCSKTDNCSA